MGDKEGLLPCPYCGNQADISGNQAKYNPPMWSRYCVFCQVETEKYYDMSIPISIWNTRVNPKEE